MIINPLEELRRIASIGLLSLLLYNMFGLSLAVLFFDKSYQTPVLNSTDAVVMKMYLPSLPYSGDLQIEENAGGLVRHQDQFYNPTQLTHQNDTLYVTLQPNEAARDHFFELANAVQLLSDQHSDLPKSPYSKAVELLSSLAKIYMPNGLDFKVPAAYALLEPSVRLSYFLENRFPSYEASLNCPPPERC